MVTRCCFYIKNNYIHQPPLWWLIVTIIVNLLQTIVLMVNGDKNIFWYKKHRQSLKFVMVILRLVFKLHIFSFRESNRSNRKKSLWFKQPTIKNSWIFKIFMKNWKNKSYCCKDHENQIVSNFGIEATNFSKFTCFYSSLERNFLNPRKELKTGCFCSYVLQMSNRCDFCCSSYDVFKMYTVICFCKTEKITVFDLNSRKMTTSWNF